MSVCRQASSRPTASWFLDDALYYAALAASRSGRTRPSGVGVYRGTERLDWWIDDGQHQEKAKEGGKSAHPRQIPILREFSGRYANGQRQRQFGSAASASAATSAWPVRCLSAAISAAPPPRPSCSRPRRTLLYSAYVQSKGNPIEDAKALFRDIRAGGVGQVAALALTGYGKDLLKDILGADLGVVETVAHAKSALHVFPDADVICDVGGTDVKIMILRQGTVADFRLNSQCSSGNGAFLQGVAERYGIPLEEYADRAFEAKAMPSLAMGCGVFLQSDIVNQQRKGWSAEEIMAGLASVLPLNVWVYAGQLQNLRAVGRRFVLQGGTHRNLAVVKAQVDFITSKVPDAEILIHPYSGEAGAIGAALCALEGTSGASKQLSRFRRDRGARIPQHDQRRHRSAAGVLSTASGPSSTCWFPARKGRPWSKVPLEEGWERVISGNSCPKGLLEDVNEMKVVKAKMEEGRRVYPNIGEMVRAQAFRRAAPGELEAAKQRIGIPKVLNVWTTHQFWLGFFGALGIPSNRVVFSSDTSEEQMRE